MTNSFVRYFNTIKYLKLRQTLGRALARIKYKARLFRLPEIPDNVNGIISPRVEFLKHDPWNNRNELNDNIFNFLNCKAIFENEIDWKTENQSHLWQYNLHYFDYLFLLDENEKEKICLDWIDKNPVGTGVGWMPYPLSLRIANWVKEDIKNLKIKNSIYRQASFLFRNSEFFHPGNHYLENAKALIFAGIYFKEIPQTKKWLKKGIEIFSKELPVQVLADGGYFELTQMYHAIMLHGFLDILNILPKTYNLYNTLYSIVIKMLDFLKSNTHPNGEIALFNDSTTEIAPSTAELFDYAGKLVNHTPQFKSSFVESGYYVYKDEDIYMIIDGGAIGPNYLPAHAHSDIFSYELSLNNEKVIVDTGVFEYTNGKVRQELRSTKAHNTVCIDNLDQVECWGSFRVARRYEPQNVTFEIIENGFLFSGSYNGYSKLIGQNIVHTRTIILDKKGRKLTISDKISGFGSHLIESFIHCEPGLKPVNINENSAQFLTNNNNILIDSPISQLNVEESFYYPRFGERIKNKKLIMRENSELPQVLEYTISY